MIKHLLMAVALVAGFSSCAASGSKTSADMADTTNVKVEVTTSVGDFTILLYGDTPIHRDNFVKLVEEGYYNNTLFHRVINEFMIQAGDPESKNAQPGQMLGSGDPGYTLEAEFVYPKHFHKRGALAAARTGDAMNPEKRSSGSQFYVVTGRTFSPAELDQLEQRARYSGMNRIFEGLVKEHIDEIRGLQAAGDTTALRQLQESLVAQTEAEAAKLNLGLTPEQREAYSTVGGSPHLDGDYTVFGEVLSGMDTIEKIEKAETDANDRPKEDIRIISMKIVK